MADITDQITNKAVARFLDHAYEGHVIPGTRFSTNEFTNPKFGESLNIETPENFRKLALETLQSPDTAGVMNNLQGSHAYFYNANENIVIAIEPKTGGSMFRPYDVSEGYFEDRLLKAQDKLGDNFVHVEGGGIDALRNAYHEKFGRFPELVPLDEMAKSFKTAAAPVGDAVRQTLDNDFMTKLLPKIGGRLMKFVPLAGTAATFAIGRAEAAELRDEAQQAVADGKLPPEALADYEMVLNAHQLQVNADVSIIGREVDAQEAFAEFVRAYEDHFKEHPEMLEDLEPPSLAEDLFGQEMDNRVMPQWAQDYTAAPGTAL